MNWFNGYLELKCIRGRTTVHRDISFSEAQRILDAQEPSNIVQAMYFPSGPVLMGHSKEHTFKVPA